MKRMLSVLLGFLLLCILPTIVNASTSASASAFVPEPVTMLLFGLGLLGLAGLSRRKQ